MSRHTFISVQGFRESVQRECDDAERMAVLCADRLHEGLAVPLTVSAVNALIYAHNILARMTSGTEIAEIPAQTRAVNVFMRNNLDSLRQTAMIAKAAVADPYLYIVGDGEAAEFQQAAVVTLRKARGLLAHEVAMHIQGEDA